jgi:hypothetical protein
MARPKRNATCHPEKAHIAKGLCSACYARLTASTAEGKARLKRNNIKYYSSEKGKSKLKAYRKNEKRLNWQKKYSSTPEYKQKAKLKQNLFYNSPKGKAYHKAYSKKRNKERYKTDISFKLKKRLRQRVYQALKGEIKGSSVSNSIGCSAEALRLYLESLFQPGMSWDNWGVSGWHIDHIRPLASFDLSNPEQLRQACHYTNLQPLWAEDNLRKGAMIDLKNGNED